MFLSLELQSYGLYILCTLHRNSELATSAGLTYFLLGGLSSCFILLGTSLLYGNTGATYLDGIYILYSLSNTGYLELLASNELITETVGIINQINPSESFDLALLILSVGFLFKVSSAPFHFWSPVNWSRKSNFTGSKLSNSGNTLKLLVPNHIRNNMCGWINHWGMVISQKISEQNMGYRGSKSDRNWFVKEQRVDGSYPKRDTLGLRCTLMGFERNYQIKVLSKQILHKQSYTTNSIINSSPIKPQLLDPWFVTGFSDAEGSFMVIVRRDSINNTGWRVEANFTINLHNRDLEILKSLQTFFGNIGVIGSIRNNCCDFSVTYLNHNLMSIIPHFEKYPLITKKHADYLLFREVVLMISRKEHLTDIGIQTILNIRTTMNRGLTPALIEAFPETVPVKRPLVQNPVISDSQWVAGFASSNLEQIRIYTLNRFNNREGGKTLFPLVFAFSYKICIINLTTVTQRISAASGLSTGLPPSHIENKRYYSTSIKQKVPEKSSSLVLWGTNLSSTVGERFTRSQLSMVNLPIHIQSIMVGLILSDAWVKFSSKTSKNDLLGFSQSSVNSEYFWFVFFSLSHYCSSYPLIRVRNRLGTKTITLQFETRSMPCITELRNLFYLNNTKVVPENIYKLLTPIALAQSLMGDGSAQKHGIVLCTDSYSLPDVVRLMNVLIIRYRLNCTLRKHGEYNRIYIREGSMPLLRSIVRPYFHDSMLYKL